MTTQFIGFFWQFVHGFPTYCKRAAVLVFYGLLLVILANFITKLMGEDK